MMRLILTLLLASILQLGFSQDQGFESFIAALDSYRSGSTVVATNDTTVDWSAYDMKWIKITGTYGGSPYCCGGKLFVVNSGTDTLFPDTIAPFEYAHFRIEKPEIALEIVGDRYVIERRTYAEPRPTSAFHFVYVDRYYRAKED